MAPADDPTAGDAALETLRVIDDPDALVAALRILVIRPVAARRAEPLAATSGGLRRAAVASLLLRSADEGAIALGAKTLEGTSDDASLAFLTKNLDISDFVGKRAILWKHLAPAAERGDIASLVFSAFAGLVPPERGMRSRKSCYRPPPPARLPPRSRAPAGSPARRS